MASTTINVQSASGTSLSSTSNDSSTWSEPQICREYDVFLNFRGEDTRYTFTDHLYNALVDKCIRTFKDDEELAYGKPIKRELLDAIDKPRMAVIILSKDYASSTWCLEELAKIVERMEDRGMRVLPIFYHVDPRDVQNQTGTFASAFDEHGNHFKDQNIEKVKTWRDALKLVANLSEHYLKDGSQSKFMKSIVQLILCELRETHSNVDGDNQLVETNYLAKEEIHGISEFGIPKWFNHKKYGSSVSIPLPSGL